MPSRPGTWCRLVTCCAASAKYPGLAKIMERLHMEGGESLGQAAAALEFALEGLYLMRRLSKDSVDGGAVYRT